jgi:cold shock CspA family protein
MNGNYEGTVAWYNVIRGFGFIIYPDHKDIFFHARDIVVDGLPPLRTDDRVTFTAVAETRGLRAINVKRIKSFESKGANHGDQSNESA